VEKGSEEMDWNDYSFVPCLNARYQVPLNGAGIATDTGFCQNTILK